MSSTPWRIGAVAIPHDATKGAVGVLRALAPGQAMGARGSKGGH